jgi:hypothetical protein
MKIATLNSPYLMAALGLAAFLATPNAQAQNVIFGTPQTITGDSNLITPENSNVTEFDALVPATTIAQTVDGVTFNASSAAGGATVGDSNISLTLSANTWSQFGDNNGGFPANPPTASTAFAALITSGGVFDNVNFDPGVITISNLTLGATYDVQIFNYSHTGQISAPGEDTIFSSGNSADLFDDDGNGNGQFVTGSFTALSSTELIQFSAPDSGVFTPVVGAINVEQVDAASAVPEPSTYALLLSGVLALIFFNVRKRRSVS